MGGSPSIPSCPHPLPGATVFSLALSGSNSCSSSPRCRSPPGPPGHPQDPLPENEPDAGHQPAEDRGADAGGLGRGGEGEPGPVAAGGLALGEQWVTSLSLAGGLHRGWHVRAEGEEGARHARGLRNGCRQGKHGGGGDGGQPVGSSPNEELSVGHKLPWAASAGSCQARRGSALGTKNTVNSVVTKL